MTVLMTILRHGEPVGGKRYRGDKVDDALSELGWAQMRARVAALDAAGKSGWTKIVSSPLIRCRAFAETLAEERSLPLEIDANLRERGFGCWEGLTPQAVREKYPEDYQGYKADPVRCMPEGGEAMDGFYARVTQALSRHATGHNAGENILVIGHAVVIRTAVIWALKAPPASTHFVETHYACCLRLAWRDTRPSVLELLNQ